MLTLIVLNGPEKGQTFHLAGDQPELLGRQGTLCIPDTRASRRHAEVRYEHGTWVIADAGSSNGTWVNGKRIAGLVELQEGDQIQIGRCMLVVGHLEAPSAAQFSAAPIDMEPARDDVAVGAETPVGVDDDGVTAEQIEPPMHAMAESVEPERPESPVEPEAETPDDERSVFELAESAPSPPPVIELEQPAESESPFIDLETPIEPTEPIAEEEPIGESITQETGEVDQPFSDLSAPIAEAEPVAEDAPQPSPLDDSFFNTDAPVVEAQPADAIETPDEPAVSAADGPIEMSEDDAPDAVDEPPEVVSLVTPLQPRADTDEPAEPVAQDKPEAAPFDDFIAEPPPAETDQEDDDIAALLTGDSDGAAIDTQAESAVALEEMEEDAGESAPTVAGVLPPSEPKGRSRGKWLSGTLSAAALLVLAVGVGWYFYGTNISSIIAGRSDETKSSAKTPPEPAPPPAQPQPTRPVTPPASRTSEPDTAASTDIAAVKPESTSTTTDELTPAVEDSPEPTTPTPLSTKRVEPASSTPPADAAAPEPASAALSAAANRPAETENEPESSSAFADSPDLIGRVVLIDRVETSRPKPAAAQVPEPASSNQPLGVVEAPPSPLVIEPQTTGQDVVVPEQVLPNHGVAVGVDPQVTDEVDRLNAVLGPSRRVAFLADVSGSLVDTFPQVLEWLTTAVRGLDSQQKFTVIFFRKGETIEAPPSGLKAVNGRTRRAVTAWMSPTTTNVAPHGRSDVRAALKIALSYEVDEIYILSDNAMSRSGNVAGAGTLVETIRDLCEQAECDPVINTVQFIYEDPDNTLRSISEAFNGTFEFIGSTANRGSGAVELFEANSMFASP